jgi:hypothetical protein
VPLHPVRLNIELCPLFIVVGEAANVGAATTVFVMAMAFDAPLVPHELVHLAVYVPAVVTAKGEVVGD